MGLTQDQFGLRYGVSGPAVFKFEKGYVKPSLELWLKMAADCDIPEKKALLLWIKAKLPREYQSYIDLSATMVSAPIVAYEKEVRPSYATITDSQELRRCLVNDPYLPQGMRSLFKDDEFWVLYRPTGQEIQLVIEKFGNYADAKESVFRDAFRLVREFTRSEYRVPASRTSDPISR
jgi:transcriptional regulator with XRE-family HTH domain